MNKLYHINNSFGITEKNGIAVVSSRKVSEVFNKSHDNVLKSVRSLIEGLVEIYESEWKNMFYESTYKNIQNKKMPEFLMTKSGFSLIAMGFTGKKALMFKVDYINAFEKMEFFIKSLLEAKADFPEFTDAIMISHEETKSFHFSNECDMINKIVIGMTAAKYREINRIKAGESIRPFLTCRQIDVVKSLQSIDIGLIHAGLTFNQRKEALIMHNKRILQKLLTA